MNRAQLHTMIHSLLTSAKKQSSLAVPNDPLFTMHMGVAMTIAAFADALHEVYKSTPHDDSFVVQPEGASDEPASS